MFIDIEENQTDVAIKKIIKKIDVYKSVFDGYTCETDTVGYTNVANQEVPRFNLNFPNLSFLDNFIKQLNHSLLKLPGNEKILDQEIGYQFPTNNDISASLSDLNCDLQRVEGYNIINKSQDNINEWLSNLITLNTNKDLQIIKYITGKIGSGKSAFIDLLFCGYYNKFSEHNILLTKIEYEDFKIDSMQVELPDDTLSEKIKNLIFKHILKSFINNKNIYLPKSSLNTELFIYKKFQDNGINLVKVLYDNQDSVNEISEILQPFALDIIKYLKKEKSVNFLIVIDGFDKLDPKEAKTYFRIINILKDECIYNQLVSEINFHYIMTLRNCTYEYFENDDTYREILIPINEQTIITRGIKYLIYNNDNKKILVDNQQKFINLINIILDRLSIIFKTGEYNKNLIELFDYNHRDLLRYIYLVLCFIINKKLDITKYTKSDSTNHLEIFINDIFNNLDSVTKFLERKHYVILDILLLKHKSTFKNSYKCLKKDCGYTIEQIRKERMKNKESTTFFNNIYNYCI